MVFTDTDATTLVAWTSLVLFAVYSGSMYLTRKFALYYQDIIGMQDDTTGRSWIRWAPPVEAFGVIWAVIAACKIAANTLWTINYQNCYTTVDGTNPFFIVFITFAIVELIAMSTWAPIFIKWGSPRGAMWMSFLMIAAAVTNVTIMGLTLAIDPNTQTPGYCLGDKTAGAVSIALYALPLVWYLIATYVTWQWIYVPVQFPQWLLTTAGKTAMRMFGMDTRRKEEEKSYGYTRSNASNVTKRKNNVHLKE